MFNVEENPKVLTPRTRAKKFLALQNYQKILSYKEFIRLQLNKTFNNENELEQPQQNQQQDENPNTQNTIINVPPRKSMIQTPSTNNLIRHDDTLIERHCCSIIGNNCWFLCAQIKAKFHDDLLIGQEHSKKILPDCKSPSTNLFSQKENLTDDEKMAIVCADPKFGMFSLFKYHLRRGYRNEILKAKNAFYCSHIFSLLFMLPILIFVIQWVIYIALISSDMKTYNKEFCPNEASIEMKAIILAVSMLYFVRSFFLWDNLTDRTRLNRMMPSIDIWVMIDTFQEFGFNLLVYLANLWIVYYNESLTEMILNSLAMEFLMNLDNEFEEIYFKFLPEAAVDIYDNVFVNFKDNQIKLKKRKRSCAFNCVRCVFYIPFKLLVLSLLLFPVFCFVMMIYGPICK
jgi:hypothetical protein